VDPLVDYELNYGPLDRLLHRVAFLAPFVQLTAADVEDTLFGSAWAQVRVDRPVFITSLPRAGTTVMLDALHRLPSLASHTYRDMPFVMAPVLWARFGRSFQRPAELRERAHADGVQVSVDSPEAFEEILWRAFWPRKYGREHIELWTAADANREAQAFLTTHIRKIVALRRPDRLADARYVSKNNGNLARLDLLPEMFPGARILVPVRHPLEHAGSLLKQHTRFRAMQREEPFVRRYMADVGHYEFGDLHRPIAFPGLEPLVAGRDPLTLDYWVGYWIAAFEHVLARRHRLVLVSYEACCRHPARAMAELCERLELDAEGALPAIAALFRPAPPARDVEVDPALRARADALHAALTGAPETVGSFDTAAART
jgi:hypothetical protein